MEKNLKGKQDVKYQGRGGLQSEIGWSWRDKETSFLEKKKKKRRNKEKWNFLEDIWGRAFQVEETGRIKSLWGSVLGCSLKSKETSMAGTE